MIPHSGKDSVAASITNDVVTFGGLTLNPFASILASPSKSFDLQSFYFGCGELVSNPQIPSIPLGCSIAVTGFDQRGKQIPVAMFSYSPNNLLGSPMALAALPATFKNAKNVTLGVATSSLDTASTLLIVDDVTHCNY